ncbi:MAG: capsular exopolysaccharide family [Pedosphaera sp.]|nr:capsular exopolysaccharide family [Pedosphaera sp.]
MRPKSTIPARILLVTGGVFLCLAVRAWVLFLMAPERYHARALVQINWVAAHEAFTNTAPLGSYFTQTEFEIMQSEMVLDQTIAALGLNTSLAKNLKRPEPLRTSESRRQLKQSLELLTQPGGTNLINIIVSWDDQVLAAKIANGIADAYFNHRQDQWRELHAARTNAAQAQLEELQSKIKAAQNETWQLRTNLGLDGLGPSDSTPAASADSSEYAKLVIENQAECVKWEHVIAALKALDHRQLVNTLPTVVPDQVMSSLLNELNKSQVELAGLQVDHGEQHPEVIRAQASIADLSRKIDGRTEGILAGLELRLASLKAVVENAASKNAAEKRNAQTKAAKLRPYLDAKGHLEGLEQAREALRKNLELQPDVPKLSPVDIVSRAEPPLHPAPRNSAPVLIPTVLGMIFVIAGLLLLIRSSQAKLRHIRHEA